MRSFLDSSDIADDGTALAERVSQDGYIYLPRLIPRDVVMDLRRQLLALAAEGGWLKPGHPVEAAIAEPAAACEDLEPAYMAVYRRMYLLEDLHALQHHPAILSVFERMLGGPVLVHPRFICRSLFPARDDFTTPAHQDYPHVQGTTETFTTWIPIGDVSVEMGGLQLAAGSHRRGVCKYRVTRGAGGMEVTDPLDDWVGGPFEAGDVLIFHSLTVHRGSPNRSVYLRQSMDGRYQRASDPVVEDALHPVSYMWTWDQIYAGWRSDRLKYYWRALNPKIAPFDTRWYDWRDRTALEMAERGDDAGRAVLLRVAVRDPDPQKRQRANDAIARLDAMRAAT